MSKLRFRLNGVETEIDADPDTPLLTLLRGQLGLTGSHFGCGVGECGACTVLLDDHAINACDTPLWSVADKDITTIEGLGSAEQPHPLQRDGSLPLHGHAGMQVPRRARREAC